MDTTVLPLLQTQSTPHENKMRPYKTIAKQYAIFKFHGIPNSHYSYLALHFKNDNHGASGRLSCLSGRLLISAPVMISGLWD